MQRERERGGKRERGTIKGNTFCSVLSRVPIAVVVAMINRRPRLDMDIPLVRWSETAEG